MVNLPYYNSSASYPQDNNEGQAVQQTEQLSFRERVIFERVEVPATEAVRLRYGGAVARHPDSGEDCEIFDVFGECCAFVDASGNCVYIMVNSLWKVLELRSM